MTTTPDDPTPDAKDWTGVLRRPCPERGLDTRAIAVAAELTAAAAVLAGRLDGVTGEQWQRGGRRGDGAEFTVGTFARYFIHDPVHHLHDVTGERAAP